MDGLRQQMILDRLDRKLPQGQAHSVTMGLEETGPTTAFTDDARGKGKFSIRPTLVIGLGGTGHRIVTHLKAFFIRAYGEEQPAIVKFMVFDTADEDFSVPLSDRLVSLERDSELFNIGNTPVPKIIQNIDRQPAIKARLPTIAGIPPVALRAGAKQIRPLGLLAFLWRYSDVERRLKDAIWELAGKDTLVGGLGLSVAQSQGINVFVCSSLVGGTGSGMFLDIAYLVRSIFDELGTMGDFCYVTGVGLLPQAFRGIEGPNIVPNTVAALKELGHCMLKGGFVCQYPNGRLIDSYHAPFNIYYLIDGVDEQGHTWRGLTDLCPMVAEGLFLQIGSQLGKKGENDFDNVDEILGQQTEGGEGTFCGSFGLASMYFPAQQVVQVCATRLARTLIEETLLRSRDRAQAQRDVEGFMQARGLDEESLVGTLARDDEGLPLTIDLPSPAWLEKTREHLLPQETIRYVRDYERVRLNGDYKLWVVENLTQLKESLAGELWRKVTGLVDDPTLGVPYALQFLEVASQELNKLSRALDIRRESLEAEGHRWQREVEDREEALIRAPGTGFLLKRQRVAGAQRRYLDSCRQLFSLVFQTRLCESAVVLLAHLRQVLDELGRDVNLLLHKLKSAAHFLTDEERSLNGDQRGYGAISRVNLADPEFVDRLYQEYRPSMEQVLTEIVERGGLFRWRDLNFREIAFELMDFTRGPFTLIGRMGAESAIQTRGEEVSPEAHKEMLFKLATPSWNLDTTRLEDGGAHLKAITVLGVYDEGQSIYHDSTRILVSTHDPYQITAFLATVGASFSVLQQYPGYERCYEKMKGLRPLHVIPQFQSDNEQAKLAFALGLIFGMIFSRGFYFYFRPADSLDRPVKLDNGLANSIRQFGLHETMVGDVLERVERRIEEIGTSAALETLRAYYEDQVGDEEGPSATEGLVVELKKLIRAYAADLRQTQRVASVG